MPSLEIKVAMLAEVLITLKLTLPSPVTAGVTSTVYSMGLVTVPEVEPREDIREPAVGAVSQVTVDSAQVLAVV